MFTDQCCLLKCMLVSSLYILSSHTHPFIYPSCPPSHPSCPQDIPHAPRTSLMPPAHPSSLIPHAPTHPKCILVHPWPTCSASNPVICMNLIVFHIQITASPNITAVLRRILLEWMWGIPGIRDAPSPRPLLLPWNELKETTIFPQYLLTGLWLNVSSWVTGSNNLHLVGMVVVLHKLFQWPRCLTP